MLKQYKHLANLATTDSADIFLAQNSGNKYVIKVMKKHVYEEGEIMKLFDSKYVIRLYSSLYDYGRVIHIMEYAEGGDLHNFISMEKVLSEAQAKSIARQLGKAIKHIHSHKIIHRDIKTENVFISRSGCIKLGDFGLSESFKWASSKRRGTAMCLAPEVARCQVVTKAVDWWGLGIVIYEMLDGHGPYDEMEIDECIYAIGSGYQVPGIQNLQCSDAGKNCVSRLLDKNVKKRLCSLRHKWL